MTGLRIERVVTSGAVTLDGGTWNVDNNVWIVGDDREAVVIDAVHDADAVAEAVGDRQLTAIVCTHTHPDRDPDGYLSDNQRLDVAGTPLRVLHTPGHTPGAICLHLPELGTVFTGDTLFAGGPGATGRSYSDFPTIIRSIRARLLVLPGTTAVRTGHGADTTIGDEAPHLATWIARGR